MTVTKVVILCQECNRAPAEWNFEIAPGLIRAMCDGCKRKTDKIMVDDISCRHGIPITRKCGACDAGAPSEEGLTDLRGYDI